jgi:hypothetical protein
MYYIQNFTNQPLQNKMQNTQTYWKHGQDQNEGYNQCRKDTSSISVIEVKGEQQDVGRSRLPFHTRM